MSSSIAVKPSTTSVVSWNLPWGSDTSNVTTTYWASVVGADSSATTVQLQCSPNCDGWTPTMTVGPWAQVTDAPGASAAPAGSTGAFDLVATAPFKAYEFNDTDPYATTYQAPTATHTLVDLYGRTESTTYSYHCDMTSATKVATCTQLWFASDTAALGAYVGKNRTWTAAAAHDAGPTVVLITITAGLDKLAATKSGTSPGATTTGNGAAALGRGVDVGMLGLVGLVVAFLIR